MFFEFGRDSSLAGITSAMLMRSRQVRARKEFAGAWLAVREIGHSNVAGA